MHGISPHRSSHCGLLILCLFAVALAQAEAPHEQQTTRYVIDAAGSTMVMYTFSGGLFPSLGHDHTIAFRRFAGEIRFVPDAPERSSFWMRIRADSLEVLDDAPEEDREEVARLTRDEVLEAARYPEIIFRSVEVTAAARGEGRYDVTIKGKLALHGVTRTKTFRAQVERAGDTLRARGTFTLSQRAYGMRPPSFADGVVRVKDEVRFSFDVMARRATQ